jgi:hypothetical protein
LPEVDDSARRALAAAMAIETAPSIDATEKPLPDRSPRSLPSGGGCSVVLGVLCVAVGGIFVRGLWTGGMSNPFAAASPEQFWILHGTVLFVMALGAGLARSGLLAWRGKARAKALKARPDQPWLAESTWDPQGAVEQPNGSAAGFFVAAFVFLVLAPFNVLARHAFDTSNPIEVRLLVAAMLFIPNFFIYLVLKGLFSAVRDRRRCGRPYLAFDPFPFFLGETLAARLTAKVFAGQDGVVAVLRCIDERMTRSRSGTTDSVQAYQVYEARQPFPGRFGGEDVLLTFALPTEPPTELLRQPPRYWELEVRGRNKGVTVVFTVPVYSRPGGVIPG